MSGRGLVTRVWGLCFAGLRLCHHTLASWVWCELRAYTKQSVRDKGLVRNSEKWAEFL